MNFLLAITLLFATLLSKVEPNLAQLTCNTLCTDALYAAVGGDANSTTCTNAISQQYAQCLDCGDQTFDDDLPDSQAEYNVYLEFCTDSGFGVKNFTIPGSFQASKSGGGATPSGAAHGYSRASLLSVGWISLVVLAAAQQNIVFYDIL
ncbi:hypothetical protein MSAN_01698600 [Mycena sanguinolenta]|uniref:Uncharacterized protein n=1 Tax=Mycena sanguinolenta TaxID=230812 RepID=A0A8H6XY35_9AGAR|nr:hypothetical protein MSAN_01698600 [Mycena sanguinolenta]